MASIQTAGGTISGSAKEMIITAATGVAVVVVLYWLAKREVSAGVSAVAESVKTAAKATVAAVNPVADTNLAYKAASGLLTVGGNPNNSLGTQIFDDVQALKKSVIGENASLGTKIYDGVEWLKSVF